jgi:mannose-6-phosphate isomerase-like protein (cupin superfamily)
MAMQLSTPAPVQSSSNAPRLVPHDGGTFADLSGFGIHWKIEGAETGKRFSVVHHPLAPRHLAAPLHRHHREDEYSYVLGGRMGAMLGDEVVVAEAGSWVFKPRGQWHSFWNAGEEPCEIIEVISPAGFEAYFRELAAIWPDLSQVGPLLAKYELDMDPASVPMLCQRFGLVSGIPAPVN